jgi:hypothetical protein
VLWCVAVLSGTVGGMGKALSTEAPYKFGPEQRVRFLDLIRAGMGRQSACRAIDIHPETMRRYSRASQEFRDALADAEEEAAEPVEAKLYEAAKNGEPWAVKEWLSKRMKARWGETTRVDVNVSGTVEIEPGPGMTAIAARVGALQQELEARRAALVSAGDVINLPEGAVREITRTKPA